MKNIIILLSIFLLTVFSITTYRNSKKEKPLVLIIMGPPGAGKGTHASDLSKTFNIPHISTGDLFRENIKNQTELGLKAKTLIDAGNLVPDNLVVDMLFNHINSKGYEKTGYILDGFPRTVTQAKALSQRIGKNFKQIIINLDILDDMLVERITGRLICKDCQAPYHIKYCPSQNENICDKCSGSLYQRKDDTVEVLKNRLEVYNKDTKPILDFYKSKKEFFNIDSNGNKETVFENILKSINHI